MNNVNIARATKLALARVEGQQSLQEAEQQIAEELILPAMLAQDPVCRTTRPWEFGNCSEFEATRQVGITLGNLIGNPGKYDLTICGDRVFRGLWALRQVIDQTGINYGTYIGIATDYARSQGWRISPTALARPAVVTHVLAKWVAHEFEMGRSGSFGEGRDQSGVEA